MKPVPVILQSLNENPDKQIAVAGANSFIEIPTYIGTPIHVIPMADDPAEYEPLTAVQNGIDENGNATYKFIHKSQLVKFCENCPNWRDCGFDSLCYIAKIIHDTCEKCIGSKTCERMFQTSAFREFKKGDDIFSRALCIGIMHLKTDLSKMPDNALMYWVGKYIEGALGTLSLAKTRLEPLIECYRNAAEVVGDQDMNPDDLTDEQKDKYAKESGTLDFELAQEQFERERRFPMILNLTNPNIREAAARGLINPSLILEEIERKALPCASL